jgi:predicted choloylglycine hydrolase
MQSLRARALPRGWKIAARALLVATVLGVAVNAVHSYLVVPPADFDFSAGEGLEKGASTRVVVLEGAPYAMGLAHGRQLKDEIIALRKSWLDRIFGKGWVRRIAVQRAHRLERHIPESMIQEMRGVADGAGVYYEDILLANTAADLVQHAMLPFGCSSLAVLPGRAASGAMIVGRNLDYPFSEALRGAWRPFVFKREGARPFLAIGVPGLIGVATGVNDRGVYVAMHTVLQLDQTADAVPNPLLFRLALEQATDVESAVEVLTSVPRASGTNAMVADGHTAVSLERRAHAHDVRRETLSGTLAVANHYTTELGTALDIPADWRWERLTRYAHDEKPLRLSDVRGVMASTGQIGINVLATLIDYGDGRIYYGSEADPAATGRMDWVDWRSLVASGAAVAEGSH